MTDLNSVLKQIVQLSAQSGVGQSRPLLPKAVSTANLRLGVPVKLTNSFAAFGVPEKTTSLPQGQVQVSAVATNVSSNLSDIAGGSYPRPMSASAIATTGSCSPAVVGHGHTHQTATLQQNLPKATIQDVDTVNRIVIKVFKPNTKREFKSYIIHLERVGSFQLRSLKEEILEQLGKKVVSFNLEFDVGYMMGTQKICFSETDNVAVELQKIVNKGYSLWCEGVDTRKRSSSAIVIDDDGDEETNEKSATKTKKPKVSALEERKTKILAVANQLKEKHGDKYNMVQYKFWAETLENERHKSWDNPPHGLIWGGQVGKLKYTRSDSGRDTQSMLKSVGDMAMTIATAIKSPDARKETSVDSTNTSTSSTSSCTSVGVSPGRKIDLQGKLLHQLELIHGMFERGTITSEQFEKRRESIMKQLEKLD